MFALADSMDSPPAWRAPSPELHPDDVQCRFLLDARLQGALHMVAPAARSVPRSRFEHEALFRNWTQSLIAWMVPSPDHLPGSLFWQPDPAAAPRTSLLPEGPSPAEVPRNRFFSNPRLWGRNASVGPGHPRYVGACDVDRSRRIAEHRVWQIWNDPDY